MKAQISHNPNDDYNTCSYQINVIYGFGHIYILFHDVNKVVILVTRFLVFYFNICKLVLSIQ